MFYHICSSSKHWTCRTLLSVLPPGVPETMSTGQLPNLDEVRSRSSSSEGVPKWKRHKAKGWYGEAQLADTVIATAPQAFEDGTFLISLLESLGTHFGYRGTQQASSVRDTCQPRWECNNKGYCPLHPFRPGACNKHAPRGRSICPQRVWSTDEALAHTSE
jgi:hypothetical protein